MSQSLSADLYTTILSYCLKDRTSRRQDSQLKAGERLKAFFLALCVVFWRLFMLEEFSLHFAIGAAELDEFGRPKERRLSRLEAKSVVKLWVPGAEERYCSIDTPRLSGCNQIFICVQAMI